MISYSGEKEHETSAAVWFERSARCALRLMCSSSSCARIIYGCWNSYPCCKTLPFIIGQSLTTVQSEDQSTLCGGASHPARMRKLTFFTITTRFHVQHVASCTHRAVHVAACVLLAHCSTSPCTEQETCAPAGPGPHHSATQPHKCTDTCPQSSCWAALL